MAKDLGKVCMCYKGAYDANTSYEKLDVVTYDGSTYCAIQSASGKVPTNTEYWFKVADKGEKGDKGETGETGDQGSSGVASADGIESWADLSDPSAIPEDTTERVNVAGAKATAKELNELNDKISETQKSLTEDTTNYLSITKEDDTEVVRVTDDGLDVIGTLTLNGEIIDVTKSESTLDKENYVSILTDNDVEVVRVNSDGVEINGTLKINGTSSGADYTDIVDAYNTNEIDTINDIIRSCAFKALFFSDIHQRTTEFERIIAVGNAWQANLNCIIDGGDDTYNTTDANPLDWYNNLIPSSLLPLVRAVGNHDSWASKTWKFNSNENIYGIMTEKTIAGLTALGVTAVQPSDVATAFENYYYVDFGNVRVIVLLCLIYGSYNAYWDDAQKNWLENVLADAKTNNKHVLIVNHGGLDPTTCKEEDSEWNSYKSWIRWTTKEEPYTIDTQHLSDEAVELVDAFITNGGHFIGYLAGHSHADFVLSPKDTVNKQYCLVTSCAKATPEDSYTPALPDRRFDLFNLIAVDTTNYLFKVYRMGNGQTRAMNEHSLLCWDYKNGVLLTSK